MKKKLIGKTGLEVSIVGLGAANIGLPRELVFQQHVAQPAAHLMDLNVAVSTVVAAATTGCTVIDTAPRYGNTSSESAVGEALRQRPELFSDCVITTKIGCRYPGDGFDHSYGAARVSLVASMERLSLSRLKIAYLHDPMGYEMDHVFSGTLRAMKEFRDAGVIEHIGLAANDPEVTADYMATGEFEIATVSGAWSLINQIAAQRIISLAREHEVGLIVTTALERGILATGPVPNGNYLERNFSPECLDQIRKIQALCGEWNLPFGAVALQWCTRISEIASVIPGACNPAEAMQNAQWGSLAIPEGFWLKLEPLIRHFDS